MVQKPAKWCLVPMIIGITSATGRKPPGDREILPNSLRPEMLKIRMVILSQRGAGNSKEQLKEECGVALPRHTRLELKRSLPV